MKYIVQELKKQKSLLPIRMGFIGEKYGCFYRCGQYYNGRQKSPKDLKQTPKIFDTKKECNEAIKDRKREDVAFKRKGAMYEIIPLDI
jgi:hypothetical protein